MNNHKFAFVICTNNSLYLEECLHYISYLNVPDSYEVDVLTITDAECMTKAYNEAILESDAKYKIFMHQDTFILNANILYDILRIFENSNIGMIGVAGTKKIKDFLQSYCWSYGMVYMNAVNRAKCEFFSNPKGEYESVEAIDGLIMITQYDIPWREDIYTGWHYYDISQSLEFIKKGYQIVVPYQASPWVMHDHGVISYTNYTYWRDVFVKEYSSFLEATSNNKIESSDVLGVGEIIDKLEQLFAECDYENAEKLIIAARKAPSLYNDVVAIYDANISLHSGDYEHMWKAIRRGLKCNPKNYELYVLLGEYYLQKNPNQAYLCFENALLYCDNKEDCEEIKRFIEELNKNYELRVNKVSFIILSYNTLDFTRTCIESIRENTLASSREIVIVDNASTDGSLEWLKEQDDIILRVNTENSGFPKGCNEGVEVASKGNDIFLLNSDTLVPPNALFWLRMGLYEDDSVGATGSVTNFAANYQAISFKDTSKENLLKFAISNNIPEKYPYEEKLHLIGFALLIKRSVYDEVGNLDERFSPGNYEDNDYGIRVIKAGYKNILCRNSFILHFGSKSFGKKAEAYAQLLATNAKKFAEKWNLETNVYFESRPNIVNQIEEKQEAHIRVLDVGCACGGTCAFLKGQYPKAEVYGVEINPHAAEIAQHVAEVVCADVETLDCPWEEEFFDYIILGNVLEYLKAPTDTLKKLYPYLKKGGHIIINVPNLKHYSVILPLIVRDDAIITKKYTAAEILLLIKDSGYVPEQILPICLGEPEGEIDEMINQLVEMSSSKSKTTFLTYQYLIKAGK